MKRHVMFLWVATFLFSFSTVSASNLRGKLALTGSGGLAIPVGDFADENKGAAKSGFALGGSAEFFVTDYLSIGGNLTYQKHGVKAEDWGNEFARELESELANEGLLGATVSADVDGDHTILSFGAFGKFLVTSIPEFSPYLKCGFGFAKLKTSFDISGDVYYQYEHIDYEASMEIDADMKPYVNIGAGMLYQVSENVAFTGEVLFSHILTDGAEADADMDVAVSYMGMTERMTETGKTELDLNVDHISAFVGLTILLGGTR
jgi:opacity protein-like surface antigen